MTPVGVAPLASWPRATLVASSSSSSSFLPVPPLSLLPRALRVWLAESFLDDAATNAWAQCASAELRAMRTYRARGQVGLARAYRMDDSAAMAEDNFRTKEGDRRRRQAEAEADQQEKTRAGGEVSAGVVGPSRDPGVIGGGGGAAFRSSPPTSSFSSSSDPLRLGFGQAESVLLTSAEVECALAIGSRAHFVSASGPTQVTTTRGVPGDPDSPSQQQQPQQQPQPPDVSLRRLPPSVRAVTLDTDVCLPVGVLAELLPVHLHTLHARFVINSERQPTVTCQSSLDEWRLPNTVRHLTMPLMRRATQPTAPAHPVVGAVLPQTDQDGPGTASGVSTRRVEAGDDAECVEGPSANVGSSASVDADSRSCVSVSSPSESSTSGVSRSLLSLGDLVLPASLQSLTCTECHAMDLHRLRVPASVRTMEMVSRISAQDFIDGYERPAWLHLRWPQWPPRLERLTLHPCFYNYPTALVDFHPPASLTYLNLGVGDARTVTTLPCSRRLAGRPTSWIAPVFGLGTLDPCWLRQVADAVLSLAPLQLARLPHLSSLYIGIGMACAPLTQADMPPALTELHFDPATWCFQPFDPELVFPTSLTDLTLPTRWVNSLAGPMSRLVLPRVGLRRIDIREYNGGHSMCDTFPLLPQSVTDVVAVRWPPLDPAAGLLPWALHLPPGLRRMGVQLAPLAELPDPPWSSPPRPLREVAALLPRGLRELVLHTGVSLSSMRVSDWPSDLHSILVDDWYGGLDVSVHSLSWPPGLTHLRLSGFDGDRPLRDWSPPGTLIYLELGESWRHSLVHTHFPPRLERLVYWAEKPLPLRIGERTPNWPSSLSALYFAHPRHPELAQGALPSQLRELTLASDYWYSQVLTPGTTHLPASLTSLTLGLPSAEVLYGWAPHLSRLSPKDRSQCRPSLARCATPLSDLLALLPVGLRFLSVLTSEPMGMTTDRERQGTAAQTDTQEQVQTVLVATSGTPAAAKLEAERLPSGEVSRLLASGDDAAASAPGVPPSPPAGVVSLRGALPPALRRLHLFSRQRLRDDGWLALDRPSTCAITFET